MSTVIHQWIEACRNGNNPRVVAKLEGTWVLMGESQFLPGYLLVVPDPVVPDLNAMAIPERDRLLHQVSIVGDALLQHTDAVRINYEILGNLQPALHVHVIPRYATEAEELRTKPVWFYDWENAPQFDRERDAGLMHKIADFLEAAGLKQNSA